MWPRRPWLGNTPRVAEKHYLQVTNDHFAQATVAGGAGGGAGGGAQVAQQVVPQPTAADRKELRKARENKAETAEAAIFPTIEISEKYAWQDSNLRPTD